MATSAVGAAQAAALSSQSLSERVYGELKQRVLTCAFAPGHHLREVELASAFNASRTPLREALNRLAQERLVVQIPYCGYKVAPLDVVDIRSTGELRLIVESEAAALAAARAERDDWQMLRSLAPLKYKPRDRKTYGAYIEANTAFHRALVRLARNPALEAVVMATLEKLHRPLYLGLDIGLDPDQATTEHLLLVEAVKLRDSAAARQLQIRQITDSNKRILNALTAGCKQSTPG